MAQANWYVCHTYSGYENKVKANLDKTIKNRHLEDQILEVRVPTQEVLEIKKAEDEGSDQVQYTEEGERIPPKPKKAAQAKLVNKKLFPGYVFVHMIMNEDNWYIVRNTRGVTGFVGPGSKPVPLPKEQMQNLGIHQEEIQVGYDVGDTVVVIGGAWKDTTGVVASINKQKQTVTINVELFGRETPVYFYTRVVQTTSLDMGGYLDFVQSFTEACLNKEMRETVSARRGSDKCFILEPPKRLLLLFVSCH